MASGLTLRESAKEMKRLKNEPLLLLAIVAIILFVGFFVVYPVLRVITFPSLHDYMQLFQKARWFTALKNSLYMTLISTVSCTAVAFLFAYVIVRLDVPCKGLFKFVTLLPIVSPPFIVALSYILLLLVDIAEHFSQGLVCCRQHLCCLQFWRIKNIIGHEHCSCIIKGNISLQQKLLHAL